MTIDKNNGNQRKPWVEPQVQALDVAHTEQFPNRGADAGGNPSIDCQRS